MPAFVPGNLATASPSGELAKPILFDCDYRYEPDEDSRLTVKWFKNKEAEPFYQWLPELQVRHFADWIKPLVNQTFVSDPHDPLKRYRSLLIKRLSMNLTGHYTCLVSSLAGQDMRQAALVVYQPPRQFTFEHRLFPAPAATSLLASIEPQPRAPGSGLIASPTQFRGLPWPVGSRQQQQQQPPATLIRPPNNHDQSLAAVQPPGPSQQQTKIVYTHDGKPIRRRTRREIGSNVEPISSWQLRQRLAGEQQLERRQSIEPTSAGAHFVLQLHHFQCQATQVSPRPVLVLTVKRDADSIAQYLHESSSISLRPRQASVAEIFPAQPPNQTATTWNSLDLSQQPMVTLFDITLSATVALNVSLPTGQLSRAAGGGGGGPPEPLERTTSGTTSVRQPAPSQQPVPGINTILSYRRGQRMSFECHLDITGTEFEQRKRISINEEGEFQFHALSLRLYVRL